VDGQNGVFTDGDVIPFTVNFEKSGNQASALLPTRMFPIAFIISCLNGFFGAVPDAAKAANLL
jgi:hypothetical protein